MQAGKFWSVIQASKSTIQVNSFCTFSHSDFETTLVRKDLLMRVKGLQDQASKTIFF